MEKNVTLEMTPTKDAEYEAAVDHDLIVIKRMVEEMKADHLEFEASRIEIDSTLESIIQTLSSMQNHSSRRSIVDILADLPGHMAFQDADTVDAYVREVRNAWNNE